MKGNSASSAPPQNQQLKDIAALIFKLFVHNKKAYAEQRDDSKYCTQNQELNVLRLTEMLSNEESLLTYQRYLGKIGWICFDLDIKNDTEISSKNALNTHDAIQELLKGVSTIATFLKSKDIPFAMEFSGNRGVHIWLLFSDEITQNDGFAIQQKILDDCAPLSGTKFLNIDRYPKTPNSNAQLGLGVKLPLSKHRKSGAYSMVIENYNVIPRLFEEPIKILNDVILRKQAKFLRRIAKSNITDIAKKLSVNLHLVKNKVGDTAYSKQRANLIGENPITLDSLLDQIRACTVVSPIIERFYAGESLKEQERTIMVGLLRRLQHADNKDFGKELLLELFSRQPNFKREITEAKLRNLNLYPPTCSYLCSIYQTSIECCIAHRGEEVQKSPVELIGECELLPDDIFEISSTDVEVIRTACLKYAQINDEIDLDFLRTEMEQLDAERLKTELSENLAGVRALNGSYDFYRPESADRTRHLVSLFPIDAIVSTWFAKILNALFAGEESSCSYGYKFESSLAGGNIFKPWFLQWIKFTQAMADIIDSPDYSSFYIVKLDIKSFYDSISLERLSVKLRSGPTTSSRFVIDALDRVGRGKYEIICTTLINWCFILAENKRGVPQGPAFARYLAEIYLMQFDLNTSTMLLDRGGQYLRWVDDIFVIVPDFELATEINAKLRADLEALSLEIRESKTFFGTVSEYRPQFKDYKTDAKYFVDSVARRSTTASYSQTAQAEEILEDLIHKPNGNGTKEENASFYLTHLRSFGRVDEQILSELIDIEYGRGSFFKHLYNEIISQIFAENCSNRPDCFSTLNGFRLEVFLNCLLSKLHACATEDGHTSLSDGVLQNLADILKTFTNSGLGGHAETLFVHILICDKRFFELEKFAPAVNESILMSCIRQTFGKNLSSQFLGKILDSNLIIDIEDAIHFFYAVMIDNNLDSQSYLQFSDKIFATALETLEKNTEMETFPCFISETSEASELLYKYHALCCLCFITGSLMNLQQLKTLWKALIVAANRLAEWKPRRPKWLAKAGLIEVDGNRLPIVFASSIGGDGLAPGTIDNHNIFHAYHYDLVLFLFSTLNPSYIQNLPSKFTLLNEARGRGMKYLEWLLDSTAAVLLYPNKRVCLQNIVENQMTVLKKNDELLIRLPSSKIFSRKPQLSYTTIEEQGLKVPFSNHIFAFDATMANLVNVTKSSKNILELFKKLLLIFNGLEQFHDAHHASSTGVPNIFTNGFGLSQNNFNPAIEYSGLCPKLVIDDGRELKSLPNTLDSAWGLILDVIENSDFTLPIYNHHTQLQTRKIRKIIPPGLDCLDQAKFLEFLCLSLENLSDPDPFEVDHCRFEACLRMAEYALANKPINREKRPLTCLGLTLENYLHVTGESSDFFARLSFLATDQPVFAKMGELLNSLRISMSWTLRHEQLGPQKLNWDAKIEVEFKKTAALVFQKLGIENSDSGDDFYLSFLSSHLAIINRGEDSELIVDGVAIVSSTGEMTIPIPLICRFGARSTLMEDLRQRHLSDLRNGLVYCLKTHKRLVLFLIDDTVRAVMDILKRRAEALNGVRPVILEPHLKECLIDTPPNPIDLKTAPCFDEAVSVYSNHHFPMREHETTELCRANLLRWLQPFTNAEASTLLNAIASHQYISKSDIILFGNEIMSHQQASIFFCTKKFNDFGGLQRIFALLPNGFQLLRDLKLEDAVQKIIAHKRSTDHDLIILTENILSGSQLEKNFSKYYLANNINIEYARKQKLHDISGLQADFIQGLRSFSKIKIIAAAYTDGGFQRVRKFLAETLRVSPDCIEIRGGRKIEAACYLNTCETLSPIQKRELETLLNDNKRMAQIFDLGSSPTMQPTLPEVMKANLFVRPNSCPKKILPIFTWSFKNKYMKPLFKHIMD